MTVKSLVRGVTPPFIWNLTRRVWGRNTNGNGQTTSKEGLSHFEWAAPESESTPTAYDAANLVEAAAGRFHELLQTIGGPEPFGCLPGEHHGETTLFWQQQAYPFAYALALSLPSRAPLKILDWGGGLGIYEHLARILYPQVEFEYHIHELPEFARRGPDFTPKARFHSQASDWEADRFDLVMASGALQYAQDWRQALRQLLNVSGRWLYLARIPTLLQESAARRIRHRHFFYGHEANVVFHVLPQRELIERAEQEGLMLVREMIGAEEILVQPDQIRIPFRGFLFQRVRENP